MEKITLAYVCLFVCLIGDINRGIGEAVSYLSYDLESLLDFLISLVKNIRVTR